MVTPAAPGGIVLSTAHPAEQLDAIRTLFLEYFAWIDLPLGFQNVDEELAALPGKYAPPTGGLWLATRGSEPAGCVAFRRCDDDRAEAKGLSAHPAFRGNGLAARLLETMLDKAGERAIAA